MSASSLELLFLIMEVLLTFSPLFPVIIGSFCFLLQLHPLLSSSITFVSHDTPQLCRKLLRAVALTSSCILPETYSLFREGFTFQFPKPCLPLCWFVDICYALLMLQAYLSPLCTCNITFKLKTPYHLPDVAISRAEVTGFR